MFPVVNKTADLLQITHDFFCWCPGTRKKYIVINGRIRCLDKLVESIVQRAEYLLIPKNPINIEKNEFWLGRFVRVVLAKLEQLEELDNALTGSYLPIKLQSRMNSLKSELEFIKGKAEPVQIPAPLPFLKQDSSDVSSDISVDQSQDFLLTKQPDDIAKLILSFCDQKIWDSTNKMGSKMRTFTLDLAKSGFINKLLFAEFILEQVSDSQILKETLEKSYQNAKKNIKSASSCKQLKSIYNCFIAEFAFLYLSNTGFDSSSINTRDSALYKMGSLDDSTKKRIKRILDRDRRIFNSDPVYFSDFYNFVLKCYSENVPEFWGLTDKNDPDLRNIMLAYTIQTNIENSNFLYAIKIWSEHFFRQRCSPKVKKNLIKIEIVDKLIQGDAIDALAHLLKLNYQKKVPFEHIDIIQEIVKFRKFNLIPSIIETSENSLIAVKFEEALLESGYREKAFRIRQLRNQLNM